MTGLLPLRVVRLGLRFFLFFLLPLVPLALFHLVHVRLLLLQLPRSLHREHRLVLQICRRSGPPTDAGQQITASEGRQAALGTGEGHVVVIVGLCRRAVGKKILELG